MDLLRSCRLEVCNQVRSFTLLLDTSEDHLCSRNIFLGIFQINHESVFIPNNALKRTNSVEYCYSERTKLQSQIEKKTNLKGNFTFAFVGIGIGEALCLSCFASKQTPKVGPNLVLSTLFNSVALGTLLDKCLLAFRDICRHGSWKWTGENIIFFFNLFKHKYYYYNTGTVKLKSLGAIILSNHKGELKKFRNFYRPAIVTKPKALYKDFSRTNKQIPIYVNENFGDTRLVKL